MAGESVPPPMIWAQRADLIYLTVIVEDVADPVITYQEKSIYFKGTGGVDKKTYEVIIPLYKAIDPEKCKTTNKERCVEMVLAKKDHDQRYWPSLTSDKQKQHWLKVDFNRWNDEEESDLEVEQGSGNLSDVTLDAYDGDDDETDVDAPHREGKPQILNVEAE